MSAATVAITSDSLKMPSFEEFLVYQWQILCQQLAREIGADTVKSWIAPLTIGFLKENTLTLFSPLNFIKERVETQYLKRIRELWVAANPTVQHVDITVKAAEAGVNDTADTGSANADARKDTVPATAADPGDDEDLYSETNLDERLTFENFVVGKPNELAYAAAMRVAEADKPQFNPLFLYGGVGLGKTHLMHAIAWKIRQCHPNRRFIYVSAEKFMYQFVRALRYKNVMAFKEQFRTVDVLMIDDVQFISGKDTTQEEFFHTFNALVDQNHQIIISADKSPSDLENMEERLKSRLGWGLVADIHPTTYELRLGILESKAASLQVQVPREVREFLAGKIVTNIRELEGSLNRIVAHATLVGRPITLDTTQEVLRDLLRSHDYRVTVDDIQRRVAEYFNIKMADMVSSRRLQTVARPRQIAMYLSKALTNKSLPEIGRKFGGRDHTTVLHACKKIAELLQSDPDFAADVEVLRRTLASV